MDLNSLRLLAGSFVVHTTMSLGRLARRMPYGFDGDLLNACGRQWSSWAADPAQDHSHRTDVALLIQANGDARCQASPHREASWCLRKTKTDCSNHQAIVFSQEGIGP